MSFISQDYSAIEMKSNSHFGKSVAAHPCDLAFYLEDLSDGKKNSYFRN